MDTLKGKGISLAIKFFKENECEVLNPKHKNSNGPDLNIIKNDEVFRVEIKELRKTKTGSFQVCPISENRKNDDFVLITYKETIVEFISMQDHLKLCCESGVRIMSSVMKIMN